MNTSIEGLRDRSEVETEERITAGYFALIIAILAEVPVEAALTAAGIAHAGFATMVRCGSCGERVRHRLSGLCSRCGQAVSG